MEIKRTTCFTEGVKSKPASMSDADWTEMKISNGFLAKKSIIAFANDDGYCDQGEPGQEKSNQEGLG